MEQQKGRLNLSIVLFPFVFIAIGALFFYYWFTQRQLYNSAIPVEATIVKCEYDIRHDADGDTRSEYDVFVDYQIGGDVYRDVYWKSFRSRQETGQIVTVKVHPDQPGRIVTNPMIVGVVGVVFALGGAALAFKILSKANGPKYRRPLPADGQKPHLSPNGIPKLVIMGFGAAALVFIVLGLFVSPMLHIGSVIAGYVTIVLIDVSLT